MPSLLDNFKARVQKAMAPHEEPLKPGSDIARKFTLSIDASQLKFQPTLKALEKATKYKLTSRALLEIPLTEQAADDKEKPSTLRSQASESELKDLQNFIKNQLPPDTMEKQLLQAATDQIKRLEQDVHSFKKSQTDPEATISPLEARHALQIITDDLIKDLESAHKATLSSFKSNVTNQIQTLQTTYPDPDDLEQKKQDLIDAFKKGQETQLKALKESLTQNIKSFEEKLIEERRRIEYLHTIARLHPGINPAIQKLSEKPFSQTTLLSQNPQLASAEFRKVKLDKVGLLSIRGDKMTLGDSVQIERGPLYSALTRFLPNFMFDSCFKSDVLSIACALKAQGKDTVTITLHDCPQEDSEIYARHAYEACIKAGYPPDKINICWINEEADKKEDQTQYLVGKDVHKKDAEPLKPEAGIYRSQPNELQKLHQQGDKIRGEIELSINPTTTTTDLRNKLTTLRPVMPAPAAAAAAATPGGAPPPPQPQPQQGGALPGSSPQN